MKDLTLAERCKLATDCLPKAEYRTRLEALHADLLARLRAAEVDAERLRAELAKCGKDNCMGRRVPGTTTWVTEQAAEARVAAAIDAARSQP
jgi:hypothetical protein